MKTSFQTTSFQTIPSYDVYFRLKQGLPNSIDNTNTELIIIVLAIGVVVIAAVAYTYMMENKQLKTLRMKPVNDPEKINRGVEKAMAKSKQSLHLESLR